MAREVNQDAKTGWIWPKKRPISLGWDRPRSVAYAYMLRLWVYGNFIFSILLVAGQLFSKFLFFLIISSFFSLLPVSLLSFQLIAILYSLSFLVLETNMLHWNAPSAIYLSRFNSFLMKWRSSWSKNSHFWLINTFFTPYAVIVVGLDTIPEVPDQAISLI